MKVKFVKNVLIGFFASFLFGVLWYVLVSFADISRIKNFELIIFTGLLIASICLALLLTRKYLKQPERSTLKKVGYVAVVTLPSFSIMVGAFYAAIFFALTYLH